MQDTQIQNDPVDRPGDAAAQPPVAGQRVLEVPSSPATRHQLRQLAAAEFGVVSNLCLLASLLSLLLVGVMLYRGLVGIQNALPIGLLGGVVVLLWLLTRRLVLSPSRLGMWQGVLLAAGLVQAFWWGSRVLLDISGGVGLAVQLEMFVLVMLLAPLVYRLPIFLVALALLGGGALLFLPDSPQIQPFLTILGTTLTLGLVAAFLVRGKRAAELREHDALRLAARLKSETADQSARVSYEQDQRHRVERDLQAVRELADSAAQAKTEFLATISHEIRTPLNGILPILEILQESALDEEQRRYVRTAFSSSRHLLRIINDILDFARAESGKLQLESIEFDLREMVASVLDLMQSTATAKGLQLQVSIEDEVPQVLRGDPIRLRQVLTNLLSNALKFTETGWVKVAVRRRRASRKEVELLFSVADSGVGMSRETSRKVFQSFTQADASTTRKHGGTGLGLVICKRLVELMGGRISVRSRLGEGSEFWFALPMRRSVHEVPSARQDLQGVRLMSVILDEDTARKVGGQLAEWGVKEHTASIDEVVMRLHTVAMLGRSWAYELLLIDAWELDQVLPAVLREVRADPLLKGMHVVVSSESPQLLERLNREFGVYGLSGGIRSAPLRRCLYRLFDVEGGGSAGAREDKSAAFRDLNLEKEDALFEVEEHLALPKQRPERSGRVLLVEDNPVNCGVVRRVLDRLGAAVLVAHNGREALELLQRQAVDMVFMDCQMPVLDGYEATRQWRKREGDEGRARLPIVAMTANAMQGDREKCLDAGMDDYLPKPVSIAELRKSLEEWMPAGFQISGDVVAVPAVSPEDAGDAVLDPQVLAELREVMGEEYRELMATFLANAPELVQQLADAAAQADIEALVVPAHSLKSSSANLGAMQLSDVARSIEIAAREGRLEDALAAHQQLGRAFETSRQALHAQLDA